MNKKKYMSYATGHNSFTNPYLLNICIIVDSADYVNKCVGKILITMWCTDPLLSGDSVNNGRCYAVGE
jgi:hypothetical protein